MESLTGQECHDISQGYDAKDKISIALRLNETQIGLTWAIHKSHTKSNRGEKSKRTAGYRVGTITLSHTGKRNRNLT